MHYIERNYECVTLKKSNWTDEVRVLLIEIGLSSMDQTHIYKASAQTISQGESHGA